MPTKFLLIVPCNAHFWGLGPHVHSQLPCWRDHGETLRRQGEGEEPSLPAILTWRCQAWAQAFWTFHVDPQPAYYYWVIQSGTIMCRRVAHKIMTWIQTVVLSHWVWGSLLCSRRWKSRMASDFSQVVFSPESPWFSVQADFPGTPPPPPALDTCWTYSAHGVSFPSAGDLPGIFSLVPRRTHSLDVAAPCALPSLLPSITLLPHEQPPDSVFG